MRILVKLWMVASFRRVLLIQKLSDQATFGVRRKYILKTEDGGIKVVSYRATCSCISKDAKAQSLCASGRLEEIYRTPCWY